MDDVIRLLTSTITKDDEGVQHTTVSGRDVFCKVQSVTRAEFFGAGRSGLNPEYVFTVFRGDYAGESLLDFHGRTYAIYRTYLTDDDYMELYAERKGGTNGRSE